MRMDPLPPPPSPPPPPPPLLALAVPLPALTRWPVPGLPPLRLQVLSLSPPLAPRGWGSPLFLPRCRCSDLVSGPLRLMRRIRGRRSLPPVVPCLVLGGGGGAFRRSSS